MVENFIKALKDADYSEYLSIPFWSWNDKLDIEELKRQISWMKDNGIGGFFMHARSGLGTEYLSDEWFECIKACADEAEKLGMDAWAYDENGWPSGFVGGKLLENEEDRDCYIRHTIGEYDENATVSYLIDGDEIVRTKKGGDGEYLNVFIETAVSTTDILNPDLVRRFLELTHEQYKKCFGDDFAKKIKGFFTDEPQYQRWNTSYSRMLPDYFKKRYGTDIFDELGLLLVEKKGYRKFRYRYWRAMQTLMLENFAKPIYEWCENNGVELTGHYAQEDSIGMQVTTNAGVMPFYQYEHIPGVDWLGRETDNELPIKQLTSAAEQLGKKKILTETFGCCGWDISPSELGRILGYHLVNGVTMFCQHLIPYAEHGNRKRDFPAHFSPINPWVEENFKLFNDTFSRLGYLVAESEKTTNVAVLHPIRSTYFGYKRDLEAIGFGVADIENGFKNTCDALSKRNVAHHYLDETLLAQFGFVKDKKIGCKNCVYDYLVIPPIITMDESTEKLLREYVAVGGKVLVMGEKPTLLETEPFDYSYLESNCTLEEIVNAQPYKVTNTDTRLLSLFAHYNGIPFVFVQNASESNGYTQTFDFGNAYKSFVKVDPVTLKTQKLPLTVSIARNEFALLIPSKEEYADSKKLTDYVLRFKDADVAFKQNALPIDYVRFSNDGINYSKPYYTSALFDKLVRERFNGQIYLKYDFSVAEIPEKINVCAEKFTINKASLNGNPLVFSELGGWGNHFYKADIAPYVKKGNNEYVVQFEWKQNENVYLAIYGENVTEGLKNSLGDKDEIEAIYIYGDFGVYSAKNFAPSTHEDFVRGEDFYIGKSPSKISEPITDGLPFFYGTLKLSENISFDDTDIRLILDGNYQCAKLKINGVLVKNLVFENSADVSDYLKQGENLIEAEITIGLLNIFGPQHINDEKYAPVGPAHFELLGTWVDGVSSDFRESYDLLKLYSN